MLGSIQLPLFDGGDVLMICVRCNKVVEGAISQFDLAKAVLVNRSRGGIMCPGCRVEYNKENFVQRIGDIGDAGDRMAMVMLCGGNEKIVRGDY